VCVLGVRKIIGTGGGRGWVLRLIRLSGLGMRGRVGVGMGLDSRPRASGAIPLRGWR